ncbi:DUF1292 domain-containing protein [Pseudothermotoga thermarum]|uniref:Uncharacterized protein n=1 Tax=Pseudothermotoga thermarum DSM 5069 TaxID=688269 RepID=F7YUZ2_9THEM|nr:DUF1292 domain-containing protein [Pseudothermotoga thermarum]AEH50276.1 protein of unknown function DUF1292 [Pseudothermotoga thermarum DSM 5069]
MNREDFEVFVLTDEDGQEHHFVILAEIDDGMKKYWICEEIMVDEDGNIQDFGEIYPFAVREDENGGIFVDSIESEEEFEKVSKAWNELLEKDEELQSMLFLNEHDHEHHEDEEEE